MAPFNIHLWLGLFLFLSLNTYGQKEVPSWFDVHYSEDQVLELTLVAQLDSLILDKFSALEVPARIVLKEKEPGWDSWEGKVELRGKYRRRVCDFPPIMIRLRKKGLRKEDLRPKYNDYKLVTHCLKGRSGNENVLKEYLAYRLYNLLSDQSFRVQLVRITYVLPNGKTLFKKRYGILLEDSDQLASRLDGELSDSLNLPAAAFAREQTDVHDMFQYMIGNSDWSAVMNRNLALIERTDQPYYVVPYDFDFSGLVNAPYAVPNTNFGLQRVTDRIYLGTSQQEELSDAIDYFQQKKPELLAYVKAFKLLKGSSRKQVKAYLEAFYQELEQGTIRYPQD